MLKIDNPLDLELAEDAAAALGRGGRKLCEALDALRRLDAEFSPGLGRERSDLVAEAGEALWCYIVQREALGLSDAEYIMQTYQVPREVRRAMAPRRAANKTSRSR